MSQADIVVIGGGIWGLSTAFHLACKCQGKRVVVLERNAEFAGETTRRAAGQIGQLRSDVLMASAVQYSLKLYSQFREQTGHDPMFVHSGSLHVAQSSQRMESFLLQLEHGRGLGIEVEQADSALMSRVAPTLNQDQVVGALYVPGDGFVDARRCALALGAAATDLGVELRPNTVIERLLLRYGEIVGVETSQGTIDTERVVVTAGPWTGALAAMAGVPLPVQAIRLERARTARDRHQVSNHPVVRIPDQSCYFRPEYGGYLFGFFDSDPEAINVEQTPSMQTSEMQPHKHRIEHARERLAPLFPLLDRLPIEEYQQGMVTCSPDGAYVIGQLPGVGGVWVATGCSAMGVAGSGAVGRWLADWVLDGEPGEDLSPLAPDRFGARVKDRQWVRDESCRVCSRYYALDSVTYCLG